MYDEELIESVDALYDDESCLFLVLRSEVRQLVHQLEDCHGLVVEFPKRVRERQKFGEKFFGFLFEEAYTFQLFSHFYLLIYEL